MNRSIPFLSQARAKFFEIYASYFFTYSSAVWIGKKIEREREIERERWKIEFLELSVKSIDGRSLCRRSPREFAFLASPLPSLSSSTLSKIKDPPSAASDADAARPDVHDGFRRPSSHHTMFPLIVVRIQSEYYFL